IRVGEKRLTDTKDVLNLTQAAGDVGGGVVDDEIDVKAGVVVRKDEMPSVGESVGRARCNGNPPVQVLVTSLLTSGCGHAAAEAGVVHVEAFWLSVGTAICDVHQLVEMAVQMNGKNVAARGVPVEGDDAVGDLPIVGT